jgi:hypothetical protein
MYHKSNTTTFVLLVLAPLLACCSGSHPPQSTNDAGKPARLASAGGHYLDSGTGRVELVGKAGQGGAVGDAGFDASRLDSGNDAGSDAGSNAGSDAGLDTADAGMPSMGSGGSPGSMATGTGGMMAKPPCKPGIDPGCHVCICAMTAGCSSLGSCPTQPSCIRYADGCTEQPWSGGTYAQCSPGC